MSLTDDRGFHLIVLEYGEKVQHYHDTDIDRFMVKSNVIVADMIENRGKVKDNSNTETIARNIEFKFMTV